MNRMMAAALSVLGLVTVILVVIWAGQRRLMYFPARHVPSPSAVGLANVESVTFAAADGVALGGWFLPGSPTPPGFTVVVFNGNAGNRAYRAALAEALRPHGLSTLLFDYRGFGESSGTPTESGLAADAHAARTYLLGRRDVDPARLVYFGESLGSAVATRLAADHAPAALILRSPFVSMAELGQFHYPILPVRWLLRDRFAPIDHVARVRCPLLVIAGDRDGIVPLEQSQRLYDAASSPKTLVIVEGADHNDEELLAGDQMIGAIVRFLEQIR
jgi:fermentation-respiration switch protein FrsA (DUF1100 family)